MSEEARCDGVEGGGGGEGDEVSRRQFLGAAAGIAIGAGLQAAEAAGAPQDERFRGGRFEAPVVVSTWKQGGPAAEEAFRVLRAGGGPLDAIERGINTAEENPEVDSVGRGGLPNAEGVVELDAAIIDGAAMRCGSVLALRGVARAISVARRVMERTRHIQLAGEGALRFARDQGFREEDLLTPASRKRWEEWKASPDRPVPGQVDGDPGAKKSSDGDGSGAHDTIGMVAIDARGRIAAGCSTSGLAWKMPGRVGDSPIIGAGLYADADAGGASATGIGEEIIRVCGSFLIVELMRRGATPQEAVEEALRRVAQVDAQNRRRQVAFIALSPRGDVGAGSIRPGFLVAVRAEGKTLLAPSWSLVEG